MGIHVAWAGTYCKHDADWFREHVSGLCDEVYSLCNIIAVLYYSIVYVIHYITLQYN